MKAYLVNSKPINFGLNVGSWGQEGKTGWATADFEVGVQDLAPHSGVGEDSRNWNPVALHQLKYLLEGKSTRIKNWKVVKISFGGTNARLETTSSDGQLEFQTHTELKVWIGGELLQQISNLFGTGVRVQLEVLKDDSTSLSGNSILWQTSELTVNCKGPSVKVAFCQETIQFPEGWQGVWCSDYVHGDQVTVKVNLIISVNQPSRNPDAANTEFNKRLLQDQVRSDLEIVAGNGTGVKCHGAFLAGHSEVLKRMLESGMEESRTMKIAMPDVSEQVVRAFLAYLYYQDLTKPLESCSLAIELLQVGHKYMVVSLEDAIKEILLEKPETWFEVDSSLTLFFFASKVDNYQDLRLKATNVLKSKKGEVMASPEYQRLFQVEHDDAERQAAKDLCNAFLST